MVIRRNVLIFHAGALGDFVLAWPLALAAGRLYPQSRIVFVTHAQKGALAEKVLRVEWADIEVGWHALFGSGALPAPAAKMLVGAHTIFSFVADAGDTWSHNVAAINPHAGVTHLRTQPQAGHASHASQFLLHQLAAFPAVQKAVEQMLRSIADRGLGTRRGGERIVVHPGSGAREKCWPLEKFEQLIQRLRAAGREVAVLVGEVERDRWEESAIASLARLAPVRQPENYIDLLRELGDAQTFIGNDSGPSQLAGIIGVPTIAIFGPTDPAVWRPLGPDVRIVKAQGPLKQLEVDEVMEYVR